MSCVLDCPNVDPPVGIEASLVERGFQTLGERVAFNNEQLKDGGNKGDMVFCMIFGNL